MSITMTLTVAGCGNEAVNGIADTKVTAAAAQPEAPAQSSAGSGSPYGYLVLGTASCVGSARTTGFSLNVCPMILQMLILPYFKAAFLLRNSNLHRHFSEYIPDDRQ